MASTISNVIEIVFGKSMTLDMEAIDLPCDATLSRATYKIDLMHMVLRRQQWANRLRAQEKHFVQLSS